MKWILKHAKGVLMDFVKGIRMPQWLVRKQWW
jgi:hypothetical protein